MNNRIAQAYGYAVCFITVIVMLIAIKSVVDSAFDLSDPIRAEGNRFGRDTPALTSFELYKIQSKRAPTLSSTDGTVMATRGGVVATPVPVTTTTTKRARTPPPRRSPNHCQNCAAPLEPSISKGLRFLPTIL